MSDISLSASMRSNLLSLQNTSKLMDMTADRLSTGKKVNSALDNPSAYFTAKGLTNRAGDLSTLLDAMTQGINTLKAAEQGIEALTSLVAQAKAVADEAYENAAAATTKATITGSATDLSAGSTVAGASTISIQIPGGAVQTKAFAATATIGDVMDWVNNDLDGLTAELDSNGSFKISSDTNDGFVVSNFEDVVAGVTDGYHTGSTITLNVKLDSEIALSTTAVGTFGTSAVTAAAVTDRTGAEIYLSLQEDLGSNWEVGTNSEGYITVSYIGTATTAQTLNLSGVSSSDLLELYGIDASITSAELDTGTMQPGGNPDNDQLIEQYNDLRTQIDALIADTSYKGINLLNGSNLTINFNEDRTSSITINGVTFDASGLGLNTASGWKTTSSVQTNLDETSTATDTLRAQSAVFGRNGSVVQTRQEFTDNMVKTLQSGADDLTLADMNEEGANMLALQTRQQLATSTLSMASQASQAVLSLFR